MDENLELSLLYDIYGSLLTSKQKDIFEEYYLYNLSLREIAENKKISYQAVRDSINSSKESLRNYESNIGMLQFRSKLEKFKKNVENKDQIPSSVKCELINEINKISEVG